MMADTTITPRSEAAAACRAGLSVNPPTQDGRKSPLGETIPNWCTHQDCVEKLDEAADKGRVAFGWTHRKHKRRTLAEVNDLYASGGLTGLGIVCGNVSNGLEMLELEGVAVSEGYIDRVADAMVAAGLEALWHRVHNGYRVRTPGGGIHWHIRTGQALGNQKLAFRPPTEAEIVADRAERLAAMVKVLGPDAQLADHYKTPPVLLAETRGEGGFTITAPSNGNVHPHGGQWVLEAGSVSDIPELTVLERDAIYDVFRSLDQCPAVEPEPIRVRAPYTGDPDAKWMDATVDHFNRDTGWEQVLAGHFELVGQKGNARYWRAVGTWSPHNATTNAKGTDRLIVFGTSLLGLGWDVYDGVGQATSYDRFAAMCIISKGRNTVDARTEVAKELRERGYGPAPRTDAERTRQYRREVYELAGQTPPSDEPPPPGGGNEPEPTPPTGVNVAAQGALADGFRSTDTGNAERLVACAAGRVRYVGLWEKFVVYDNGRWVIDTGEALVTELAKEVARRMLRLAAEIDDKDQRHDLITHARRCESASAIGSMLRLARGMPSVYTDHEEFDTDPWLFNVQNGTVDVRTGQLRPHDPDDLLTMQAPVLYDRYARAPLWRECLRRWQPDPQIRYFLQRFCGTAITGHPLELLAVNKGDGSNGKSKCFGAIATTLGPYCVEPHKSLFVAQRHEQHPTHLASLFRARLLVAPETTKGDKLDEELVKALTGGDRQRARRMRENEWSFMPTHTAVIHTNHRPLVKGTDEGIWRRLRLIPWDATIPAEERDPHLAAKLAKESSGILNWLIDGALSWQRHGLCEPEAVCAATDDYRQAEDHVGGFLADCCAMGEQNSIPARRLRDVYETWCADEGEQPWSAKALGSELTSRGFDSVKVGGGKVWIGLDAGLRSTAEAA